MKAVKGEGLPRLRAPFEHGNLFIILDIEFPSTISPEAATALKAVLPPPKLSSTLDEDSEDVEVCNVKAIDPVPTLYGVVNTAETEQELMIAFNTIVYLRDQIGHKYDPEKVKLKFNKGEVYRRVQYLDGTESKTNY